jgi:hypothetical protein
MVTHAPLLLLRVDVFAPTVDLLNSLIDPQVFASTERTVHHGILSVTLYPEDVIIL